jgi:hypothetical protein
VSSIRVRLETKLHKRSIQIQKFIVSEQNLELTRVQTSRVMAYQVCSQHPI